MIFWAFMFIMDLLVPLTMIFFGSRFEKNAPKEINAAFGYRTTMSMKNKETWQFAHKYIGRIWKICGWLVLLISMAVMFPVRRKGIIVVSRVGGFFLRNTNYYYNMYHDSHRNCTQKEL